MYGSINGSVGRTKDHSVKYLVNLNNRHTRLRNKLDYGSSYVLGLGEGLSRRPCFHNVNILYCDGVTYIQINVLKTSIYINPFT